MHLFHKLLKARQVRGKSKRRWRQLDDLRKMNNRCSLRLEGKKANARKQHPTYHRKELTWKDSHAASAGICGAAEAAASQAAPGLLPRQREAKC